MKKFTFSLIFALTAILFTSTAFSQAITQRGTATSAATTTTTLTINKPTGLQVGDVMLANIVQGDDDGGGQTITNNASRTGWTLVRGGLLGSNANNDWWGTVLYKVADAADVAATSFAFTLDPNVNGDGAVGGIIAFYNVDAAGGVGPNGTGTGPFDVAAGTLQVTGNANNATVTAPGITPVTNNAAIIMFGMGGDNNTFDNGNWLTTSPGSLTEILDANTTNGPDQCVGAAWALQIYAGATGNGTAEMSGSDRNGGVMIALKPTNTYGAPNLWSCAGTGAIRSYTINPVTGNILAGPVDIATPLTSTAALGKNKANPNDPDGYLYYLNRDNDGTLNGVVTIYSLKPDGTNHASRGTIDMNGPANNEDFSFVRLGFDAGGRGWIIAGTTANIYIASFQGNGNAAISSVNTFGNSTLAVVGGSTNEFQNGDLAISGSGTLYVVANITDGSTYVYTLNSLATPTTLTRRWTVLDDANNNFTGSVNGVAWTQSGSLHFSTSSGIYFIDQATANTISGTVNASLVPGSTSPSGLTDLASEAFPTQTTLPVKLISFTGAYRNQATMLNWETENMYDMDRFEIQRSADGTNFATIGTKDALNAAARTGYQYSDNLSVIGGNVFYYRLKMVDADGSFKYSNVIMIRRDAGLISGIKISPNPVVTGNTTVRIDAAAKAVLDIRVLDMSGRVMLRQQNNVAEGVNSVALNNLELLQRGTYILQVNDGTGVQSARFTIIH